MAELLLYERPVRLNRFAHGRLRFSPPTNYMFCRHVSAVPLIGVEFPAACPQYPIVFIQAADGQIGAQAVLSFIAGETDTAYGQPLFSDQGEPAAFLQSQIEFLRGFQQEHQRTQEFLQRIQEAELLIPQNVDVVRADRERFGVRNALVMDERKLMALPSATIKKFLEAGFFGWIYAHLISLQCFLALANRAGRPPEELVPWWAK